MPRSPLCAVLAVTLAALAALLAPAAASATVTHEVVGHVLTVESDGDSDSIVLGVEVKSATESFITLNGTATTLEADDSAEIVVSAGGGEDEVQASPLAAPSYKSLVVNGGEGADSITGGADADKLHGDGGGDQLVGSKGSDELTGGEGDDEMVWNNGDGSDEDEGEGGNDEVVVNGNLTAADDFTYQPDGENPGGVLLERIVVGEFKINLTAEHLTVNGFGGDDTMAPDPDAPTGLAGLTAIRLNGGVGNDNLAGGDGSDQIEGEAGTDHLVGFKGADILLGGEGDDTMVWNNGDGTDEDLGEAGNDEVEVNGSTGATGDSFTYRPSTKLLGGAQFKRINLVEFKIELEAEHLTVNGLAGDDTMAPDPAALTGLALATSLTLNGGDGNDNLTGGDGNDAINGGEGDDRLVGFKGGDSLKGGNGNDLMVWNNGDGTDVDSGEAGTDEVEVNGSAGADTFIYKPNAAVPGRVQFDRTSPGPFGIDLEAEHLTVNGLEGDDVAAPDPAAPTGLAELVGLALDGGAGNDNLTGGDGNDSIDGGAGNDHLVGFKGADALFGGEGDDVMVWNNGDGTDVDSGEAGTDEVEVNGSAGADTFAYKPGAVAGRVQFNRISPGPFGIDLEAEHLTVNGLEGDDVAAPDPAAPTGLAALTSIVLNGAAGNDSLTGGDGADQINGGEGNDHLVGFKGNDAIAGGDGNDVMVWNNGDGTDVDRGEAGEDEVEVNGSPNTGAGEGDSFTYRPSTTLAEGVQFNRVNLGKFEINLTAEHLTVNGLGGDDTDAPDSAAPVGLAALTGLTLNGGAGNDSLTGGDGADQINGGEGNDHLVGFKGNDRNAGNEGDDVMVWNNGDGTDEDLGEAGNDEVEVNGSPNTGAGEGDSFTYRPSTKLQGGVQFNRVNLGKFEINLTAEHLTMNQLGGDDTAAPDPAAPTGLAGLTDISLNGGGGNDNLTGADGNDSIKGGDGNDTITAGTGSDLADGQEGDDRLLTRDGASDLVRGGPGNDSAQTDAVTVDAIDGVEAVDATPPPPAPPKPPAADTKALLPTLGKAKVSGKGQKLVALVPVSCPAAEAGGCQTTVTLQTAKAASLGTVRAVVVLGSKSVKLGPGAHSTLSVRLVAGASGLAKGGVLAVRALIASTDLAGNSASSSQALSLRLPRP